MNDTLSSSSEEKLRPQLAGDVGASGSNENRRKKRPKPDQSDDPTRANRSSSSKPKPGKKSDPNAAKIIHTSCSECGKQFGSHKALYGHMRCHPERQWRGITPPRNFQIFGAPENPVQNLGENVTEDLHEVASSLVMLARGSAAMDTAGVAMEPDLGGHKAGHKIENRNGDEANERGGKEVLSSGQALGGHKMRHWEKGDEQVPPQGSNPGSTSRVGRGLDLNLPAPIDDDDNSSSSSSSSHDIALNLRLGS